MEVFQLVLYSGSGQITELGFITSSASSSFITTASVSTNTITFTKGDSTTFAITVNTGSGGGGGSSIFACIRKFSANNK